MHTDPGCYADFLVGWGVTLRGVDTFYSYQFVQKTVPQNYAPINQISLMKKVDEQKGRQVFGSPKRH